MTAPTCTWCGRPARYEEVYQGDVSYMCVHCVRRIAALQKSGGFPARSRGTADWCAAYIGAKRIETDR